MSIPTIFDIIEDINQCTCTSKLLIKPSSEIEDDLGIVGEDIEEMLEFFENKYNIEFFPESGEWWHSFGLRPGDLLFHGENSPLNARVQSFTVERLHRAIVCLLSNA